jgi:hypothetical protein
MKCFVVMPFGSKPFPDASGRLFDFDKVYRVVMQRAIKQAGLEPVRADEQKGSQIIHTDMFKALRDNAVVLADLSLGNPNVFYELGIRHVMSAKGTVLMCCVGSELPFDVKLSRVIFYKYDGQSLDWEEAERVTQELRFALEEAKRGIPDSPVHALLEKVLPEADARRSRGGEGSEAAWDRSLEPYQKIVAERWAEQHFDPGQLREEHGRSVFGIRAVAELCLAQEPLPSDAAKLAKNLYYMGQYDLANRIYGALDQAGTLGTRDLLTYGSSVSEQHPDIRGARLGLAHMTRALELLKPQLEAEAPSAAALGEGARCYHFLAGMRLWLWELTKADPDLEMAIAALEQAVDYCTRALEQIDTFPIGRLAHDRLRLLFLLRIKDQNRERLDAEGHREAILALKPTPAHHPRDVSYLRWYQAITLADAGDAEGSRRMAMTAFSEDAKIMDRPDCSGIGRRQYTLIRRFLEQHAHALRHPSLIGHVSQVLQIGHGSSVS